jgi:hypothetical protein
MWTFGVGLFMIELAPESLQLGALSTQSPINTPTSKSRRIVDPITDKYTFLEV